MEQILKNDDADELEEPELADMSWSLFGQRLLLYGQTITSLQCFHTGTTTSVARSTIRTTRRKNFALVMESDSGKCFVAITKAQGCDEIKVGDPNFIGWVRRCDGPFFGERWEELDNHVDLFLKDMADTFGDDTGYASDLLDDDTFTSHLRWWELLMRARQNDKGERSHVYVTQIDGYD